MKLTKEQKLAAHPLPPFISKLRQAVRDGIKTETRRLSGLEIINENPDQWEFQGDARGNQFIFWSKGTLFGSKTVKCRYGKSGDICYLREPVTNIGGVAHYADDKKKAIQLEPWFWKNSTLSQLHLPKRLARTFVIKTEIFPQRLHDMTETDAQNEGILLPVSRDGHALINISGDHLVTDYCKRLPGESAGEWVKRSFTFKNHFACLFDEINGAGTWNKNLWTWVIRFKPL